MVRSCYEERWLENKRVTTKINVEGKSGEWETKENMIIQNRI